MTTYYIIRYFSADILFTFLHDVINLVVIHILKIIYCMPTYILFFMLVAIKWDHLLKVKNIIIIVKLNSSLATSRT